MCLDKEADEKVCNTRLYREVQYARSTCLSLSSDALSRKFRLKRNGKNLETLEYAICV